ncbi:TonB-dependent receptor plug domain-containing protein [Thiomicrorhabdus sediminis]|nr:TonB-dependent receptor [Thiomicrorhabdus sediminis]
MQTTSTLSDIFITSKDKRTTLHSYATRIYTANDIRESGAQNLSEFLSQNTQIQVQPAYGNPFSSSLDLAGYGIESGHENIQIIVDGHSLNNIDGAAVQLNNIDLNSIQSIAILRGAGSVLSGNNSSAGAIIIKTTNPLETKQNINLEAYQSAYNESNKTLNIYEKGQLDNLKLATHIHANQYQNDGSIIVKADGRKNQSESRTLSLGLNGEYKTSQFNLKVENSASDLIYVGSTTLADFQQDPATAQTNGTHQDFERQSYQAKWQQQLNKNHTFAYSLLQTRQTSRYIDYGSRNDYLSNKHKLELSSHWQDLAVQAGFNSTQAYRDSQGWSSNRTHRDDQGHFALVNYQFNNQLTVNAGVRQQSFDYHYQSSTADNQRSDRLNASNIGVNYQVDNHSNWYANYNEGFLAPNIDRFFLFNGSFNGFIEPMTNQNLTIGYNQTTQSFDFEIEAFNNRLKNEIYYNPATFQNTNLDNSHKHGLNLNAKLYLNKLNLGAGYSYVKATIESGSYAGKILPGVAENTLSLFAQYDMDNSQLFSALPTQSLRLEHKQTSALYAISDFDNSLRRHPGYQSTDISYKLANKNLSITLGVNNLFAHKNGLYVASAGNIKVYPTLYERRYFAQLNFAL